MIAKPSTERLTDFDGVLAVILGLMAPVWFYVLLSYLQNKGLLGPEVSMEQRLFSLVMANGPVIFWILGVLKYRKQSLASVGFSLASFSTKEKRIILPLLTIISLGLMWAVGGDKNAVYWYVHYFIAIALFEEFVYRGYIHSRLVGWIGFWPGFLITGILFGVAHSPLEIVLAGTSLTNAIFNNIGFGIAAHGFFLWLYSLRRNLVIPTFIHGMLDFIKLL